MILYVILYFRKFPRIYFLFIPLFIFILLVLIYFNKGSFEILLFLRFHFLYLTFSLFCLHFVINKISKKQYNILLFIFICLCSFHLLTYFGIFGDNNFVLKPNNDFIVRTIYHFPIIRMGNLFGISPSGNAIVYSIILSLSFTKYFLFFIPILLISLVLLASASSAFFFVYFFMSNFKLLFFFLLIFLPLMLININDILDLLAYTQKIFLKFYTDYLPYFPYGLNFDLPSNSGEYRGVRDLGLLSVFSSFGLFALIGLLPFCYLLLSESKLAFFKFFFTLSIFVHGIFYFYPVLVIAASLFARKK